MAFAVHRVSSQCISFAHLFTAIRLHILAHLHLALALQIISARFHEFAGHCRARLGLALAFLFLSGRYSACAMRVRSLHHGFISLRIFAFLSPRRSVLPASVPSRFSAQHIYSPAFLSLSELPYATPVHLHALPFPASATLRPCRATLCLAVSALSTLVFAVSKPSRAIPFHCNSFTS